MPSNIRINPFVGSGGTHTYVNLTETHVVPINSPFLVRLNEVPEKQDPSNMRCYYVDEVTGAVTSRAFTEVAATPTAGQFRPDYSTKADKDESWNTGLVEFSRADAGKIVQISYTGMGTLASVQSSRYPSWYTDRGDGSDGDFIPSGNVTIGGVKNYKRVFIKQGVTVTIEQYALMKCQESFINNGVISADGQGAKGAIYKLNLEAGNGIGCGSVGGAGGLGNYNAGVADPAGGIDYKWLANYPIGIGSGGGHGANGSMSSGDSITVHPGGSGGDGGGTVIIIADTVINRNTISAKGLDGGAYNSNHKWGEGGGGGGGGGLVAIVAETIIQGTVSADGGKGGLGYRVQDWPRTQGADGQPGTVLIKNLGVL